MKISKEVIELVNKSENEVQVQFKDVERICEKNTYKVLKAFQDNFLSEIHFGETTGYGYNDIGRDVT